MKQLLTFSLALLMAASASATVIRVNNSPGSTAPYTNLLDAHAAAQPGDTIHIEGSNTNYGSLTVTKRLVFIGPGYFTAQNPNTPNSLPAVVDRFIFDRAAGSSGPNTGSAGSEVRGLSFTQNANFSEVRVNVNNLLVSQCLFLREVYIVANDVSNIHVIQNYFNGSSIGYNINSNPGLNDIVFANNIVEGNFRLPDNSTGTIQHNLFLGTTFRVVAFSGEIRSNIATTTNTANFLVSVTGSGNLTHNTAPNGQFGASNSNNTAPVSSLFVGPNGNSTDGQYQLLPTATQVKNNAHDGSDRGPFGGNLPYVLSGVPDLPYITAIGTNAPNFPSLPLQVTIKAISGN